MAALNIPMKSIKLPQATIDSAIRLMGFDYGEHLFHLLAFDFGDDGGAVGIWREGSEFCARISLDALAEFWHSAQRGIDMTEPGRALHGAALEIIEALMNEDLPKDSPEGLAFNKLVTAVETYEKATLPPPFGNAGAVSAPAGVRMLTESEARAVLAKRPEPGDYWNHKGIQRRFAEVNGLKLAAMSATTEPKP